MFNLKYQNFQDFYLRFHGYEISVFINSAFVK